MTMQASIYGRAIRIKAITTKSGKSMTVASVAVSLECRGSDEPETEWIGLYCFGANAEHLAALPDNTMVSAMGRIQVNKYTTASGEERRSLQMVVDQIMSAKSTRPNAGRKKSDNQPQRLGQRNITNEAAPRTASRSTMQYHFELTTCNHDSVTAILNVAPCPSNGNSGQWLSA